MIRYLRSSCWTLFPGLLMVLAALMLSGCGSSAPVQKGPAGDADLERFNRAGRQAFDKGQLRQAADFYRRALERAYVRDDAGAILDARYNLAVCLLHLQSYEEALEVVRRAKTEMALSDRGKSADFLLLEATIFHRRGNADTAWQVTDQILSGATQASSVIRSKTLFLRGLIASEQGNLDQLRASISDLGQPAEIQLRADHQELLGRLAMAEQNWDTAAEIFDAATNLRREALDYRGMLRAVVLAGEAHKKVGRTREAAIYYLRASRSAFWQNQLVDARHWLNQCILLANSAGEDQVIQEAQSLLQQLEELDAASSESRGN